MASWKIMATIFQNLSSKFKQLILDKNYTTRWLLCKLDRTIEINFAEKVQHSSVTDSPTYVEYQQTFEDKPKLKNYQSNENTI